MQSIRVLVAEDHAVMRATIRHLLAEAPDIDIVGEAVNGIEALHFTQKLQPDVLLLDMEMPGLPGPDVARQLKAMQSSTRILVLSAYNDGQYVQSLLDYGAAGYLLKGEDSGTILAAIRGVARGEIDWFSHSVARQVHQQASHETELSLVKREKEILRLVVEGQTNQEIGEALDLPEHTVQSYLETLFVKLGVNSRVTAAIRAVQSDLV
jgi:DNA-binding NarL/FixJ family response regulator